MAQVARNKLTKVFASCSRSRLGRARCPVFSSTANQRSNHHHSCHRSLRFECFLAECRDAALIRIRLWMDFHRCLMWVSRVTRAASAEDRELLLVSQWALWNPGLIQNQHCVTGQVSLEVGVHGRAKSHRYKAINCSNRAVLSLLFCDTPTISRSKQQLISSLSNSCRFSGCF